MSLGHCPVYWHSGLFLQPQHLQSMDIYTRYLSEQNVRLNSPYHFGVWEWSLNEVLLKEGLISFNRLCVIMPRGTLLLIPENGVLNTRSIAEHWPDKNKPLDIWLMLKRFDPLEVNVASETRQVVAERFRWITSTGEKEIPDVYQKDAPSAQVTYLTYSVCLMTETERKTSPDYEGIPLMRLCHQGGDIVVDYAYSPPALTLAGTPMLSRWVGDCYSRFSLLKARVSALCSDGKGYRHYDAMTLSLFKLILVRTMTVLSRYQQTSLVSPWSLFCQLEKCVAELSSLEGGPVENFSYDHHQLLASLEAPAAGIEQWGARLICQRGEYVSFMRNAGDNDKWSAHIPDAGKKSPASVWLVFRFSGEESEFSDLSHRVKLAPEENINDVVQHSLRGVILHPCDTLPSCFPPVMNSVSFRIMEHDILWGRILKTGKAMLYFPGAPELTEILLLLEPDDDIN